MTPRFLIVIVSVMASCGVPYDDTARPVPSDDVPAGLREDRSSTVPVSTISTERLIVWLVRDDVLVPVRHDVPAPAGAQEAVAELIAGATPAEREESLRSAIPDASVVVQVTTTAGTATVALAPAFADIPAADQVLAVGQLVLTLTDLRGVGGVRFRVDDVDIAVPLPDGTATDGVVSRDDFVVLASAP